MTGGPAAGFLLGLSTGTVCLAHCAVVLGPALASARRGRLASPLVHVLEFSAGRLIAYLGAGALLGFAAPLAAPAPLARVLSLLYVPLAAVLLLHVLREGDGPSRVCEALQSRRWIRTPLMLGLVAGFAPCAPFAIAMVDVLETASGSTAGRVLQGCLFFLAFFLGTSLFVLPVAFAGLASRVDPLRRLARSVALLVALVFLFTGLAGFLHPENTGKEAPPVEVDEADLRAVYPGADDFSSLHAGSAFPYYQALETARQPARSGNEVKTSRKLGICFVTTDVVPGRRGWAGEIPVLVGLSAEGTLTGIKVLPGRNRETPGFIDPLYAEDFAAQYRGRDAFAPFRAGEDVDGVTGATVSVETVNADLRDAARRVAREHFGMEGGGRGRRGGFLAGADPSPALLLGLGIAALVGTFRVLGRGYRMAVLALSAVLLGVWQGSYVTATHLARAFTASPPPGSAAVAWWSAVGVAVLLGALFGKIYCGWLCPFGAATELLYRVVPLRLRISERWERRLRKTRWLLLIGLPFLVVVTADPGAIRFEPLATLFHPRSITLVFGLLLGWVFLASVFVERFYCKFLCPVGALTDVLSANRLFLRRPGRTCGGCVRAEKGCRFLAEHDADYAPRKDRLRGDCVC